MNENMFIEIEVDDETLYFTDGFFHYEVQPGPFCLAFVYDISGCNFLLKGRYRNVRDCLEKNFPNCLYHLVQHLKDTKLKIENGKAGLFVEKSTYGTWKLHYKGKKISVSNPKRYSDEYGERRRHYIIHGEKKKLKFRKMPNKWLPEFEAIN